MKKTIIILLLVGGLILPLYLIFNLSRSEELTEKEKRYLQNKDTIVFVSQSRYPPFEFPSMDGEHIGMCIELARWMGTELGFKARFTSTSFAQAQKDVLSRRADVLTSFFYSAKRDTLFDFTDMMFQVPASIFVKAERQDINSIEDLQGKHVAMQRGDYALEFLQDQNINFKVVYTDNFAQATDLVLQGNADAIIGDEPIVLYHIHTNGMGHRIRIAGHPLYIGQNCMAAREGEHILISILNKGLKRAKRSGTLERIEQKWLGTRPSGHGFKYLTELTVALAALLIATMGIWVWNISLRKRVRERTKELSESEERYRTLYNDNPSMYFTVDPSGNVLSVNEFGAKHLGYTVSEMIDTPVLNLFHPDDRESADKYLKMCFSSPGTTLRWELRKTSKNGDLMWVKETARVVNKADGDAIALIVCDDVTERRRTDEALKKARNYISNIIDSMPSVLIGVDAQAVITQWNHEAQQFAGLYPDKAIGMRLEKAVPFLPQETKHVLQAIQTRQVQTDTKRKRMVKGEIKFENVTIYPLIANGVEGAVIRVDDVTEQVRLEEMMVQSEKMLSVGGLAAGMAHEINNPLAGMLQTAANLNDRLTNLDISANQRVADSFGISMESIRNFMETRGIPRMINTINESGQRIAEIVDNMLNFARKNDTAISSHDIEKLLDKSLNLASTDYDLKKKYDFKSIEIVKEYENDIPLVPCEGAKIQQVFLNVLRNGAQAMQEMRSTDNRFSPRFIIRLAKEHPSRMIRIEIEDNGPGMEETVKKRVFEPFFTTKPVGIGTGLGLSVSYFIVTENHGGTMTLRSSPGEGTTFIIRLPLEREGGRIEE